MRSHIKKVLPLTKLCSTASPDIVDTEGKLEIMLPGPDVLTAWLHREVAACFNIVDGAKWGRITIQDVALRIVRHHIL